MSGKGLLNYTSTVPVDRTIAQIQAELAKHGATRIMIDLAEGRPCGLSFQITSPRGPRSFALPVDVTAVAKVLDHQRSTGTIQRAHATHAQAERTAWRTMHDWLEVQLALVEAHLMTLEQVMLAQLIVDRTGSTLYQRYLEHDLQALEVGQ